ncbi:MAG: hypothetical protein AAF984_03640 [Verrucomicrobiota bacterium]
MKKLIYTLGALLVLTGYFSLSSMFNTPTEDDTAEITTRTHEVVIQGKTVEAIKITEAERSAFKKLKNQQLNKSVLARSDINFADKTEALKLLETSEAETYQMRLWAFYYLTEEWDENLAPPLYSYLLNKNNGYGLSHLQWHSLKDEIMDFLVDRDPILMRVTEKFTQIVEDKTHSETCRNYVIQKLDRIALRNDTQTHHHAQDSYSRVKEDWHELMEMALEEVDTSLAATAMLAFQRLLERSSEVDPGVVRASIVSALQHEKSSEQTLITAFQIARDLKEASLVSLARRQIQTDSSVPLALSAMAYMGDFATVDDLEWIDKITVRRREYLIANNLDQLKNKIKQRGHTAPLIQDL